MNRVISVLMITLLLIGCGDANNTVHQSGKYLQFMEDSENGTKQVVRTGTIEYTIQLATPAYMVCREFADDFNKENKTAIDERLKELEGYVFFLINISSLKKSSSVKEDFLQKKQVEPMTDYYQNIAAEDLHLFCDNAELTPAVYHFEDNYGLTPYNTIVAGFRVKESSELKIVFNDRYNNNPMIQAKYSKETINQIPELQIK